MPPILIKEQGFLIFSLLIKSLWNIGTNGAPTPPFKRSSCLKSVTIVLLVFSAIYELLHSWIDDLFLDEWKMFDHAMK